MLLIGKCLLHICLQTILDNEVGVAHKGTCLTVILEQALQRLLLLCWSAMLEVKTNLVGVVKNRNL